MCDQCPVRKLSTNRLLPCDDATQALDPPTDDRVPVRVHAPWMLYKALHLERLAGLRLHVFDIGEAANANFGGPGCPMRGEVAHGGAVVVILRSDDFGLLESEGKEQLRVEEAATRLVVSSYSSPDRASAGHGTHISVWQSSKPDNSLLIVTRRPEQVVLRRNEAARSPDLDEGGQQCPTLCPCSTLGA